MIRVKLDDGSTMELSEDGSVDIVNFPDRETPAEGYRRVREYPPLYIRSTTFRPNVLAVGQRVVWGSGIRKVVEIDRD